MRPSLIILVIAIAAGALATQEKLPPSDSADVGPLMSVLSTQRSQHQALRQKRFTCDLLTIEVKGVSGFNHAACAAKCLAQRHWGGHCDGPNCKCVEKKW